MRGYRNKYKQKNKRKCQDICNTARRRRYKEDTDYKIKCLLRSRFYKIINENKEKMLLNCLGVK